MSRAKKTATKPAPLQLQPANDDDIRAQVAHDYVQQAVTRVGEIREFIDSMYSALVDAYATHDGEPDVDDKGDYADCMLALRDLGHDLRAIHIYVAQRVEATAKQ